MSKLPVKQFHEEVCCDYCGMEIYGPGVPSGWKPGDENYDSGWMHQNIEQCDFFIRDSRANAQFQDGHLDAWGSKEEIFPTPPNAPSGYQYSDEG